MQRDLPGVLTEILLRQRHLLLPRGDTDHQAMIGNAIRFDVEETLVPASLDRLEFDERCKRLRHLRHVFGSGWRFLLIELRQQHRQIIHGEQFPLNVILGIRSVWLIVDWRGWLLPLRMTGMRVGERTHPNRQQQCDKKHRVSRHKRLLHEVFVIGTNQRGPCPLQFRDLT